MGRWLRVSLLNARDGLLISSVGGGDAERNLSVNLIRAVEVARDVGAKVNGIAGRETGCIAEHPDVVVPCVRPEYVTPVTESFQSISSCEPLKF